MSKYTITNKIVEHVSTYAWFLWPLLSNSNTPIHRIVNTSILNTGILWILCTVLYIHTHTHTHTHIFGHLVRRADSLKKTLMLGKTEGRRRKGHREWDGWMASPTQWTWVWANSRRYWRTGKSGVLQSIGSQRIGHDLVIEQPHCIHVCVCLCQIL